MSDPLNLYGDQLKSTTGRHGADIASQRMDDLDTAAIEFALNLDKKDGSVIDLGCGMGVQGLRFAALGLKTLLIDRLPVSQTVLQVGELPNILDIEYLQKDALEIAATDLPEDICIAYSQRFIHYLRYEDAKKLLQTIRNNMRVNGYFFLSASGLESELGTDYAGKHVPVAERYAPLAPAMAEKHDIKEAVCLYTCAELEELCAGVGLEAVRVYKSPFGNIKGVFVAR